MAGEPDELGAKKPGSPAPAGQTTDRSGLNEDNVVRYLKRHPDILTSHPELSDLLTPPTHYRGDGVVDLQRFMVERARAEAATARHERDSLVELSRLNLSGQAQIHRAVLALLDARDFEDYVHLLTTDLGMHLGIDVVTLCVEADPRSCPRSETAGIYAVPKGTVDRVTGGSVTLEHDGKGDPALFGAGTDLVRSFALIPLAFGKGGRIGVLVLGSRKPGTFSPRDATDLLSFLGRVVEITVRRWLDLPA